MKHSNLLLKILSLIKQKYLTNSAAPPKIGETREVKSTGIREVKKASEHPPDQERPSAAPSLERCPYCNGKDIIKRGRRQKKYEVAQLYYCYHCKRTFTTPKAKGRSFPLRVVLEGLCLYNIGYSAEECSRRLKEQFGFEVSPRTLRDWVHEYTPLCRYSRLRPYGMKLYSPNQVIQTVHLYHRQVYDFSVHRSKLALILQEHKHARFGNLREFLEAVQTECPHQFFNEGLRASELKVDFDIEDVLLRQRTNFANRIADLVLQAVDDNKLRHLTLQKFMLCNDSVTVATEVPVYMDKYDIEHMQEVLGFRIPLSLRAPKGRSNPRSVARAEPEAISEIASSAPSVPPRNDKGVITGHIDILQLRNGAVHILDYKPGADAAKRSRTINQLTLYALMLSRLTGLRLYDFKCGWFDEKVYFEFFPLHVVYKLRDKAKREDSRQLKFKELEVQDGDIATEEDI